MNEERLLRKLQDDIGATEDFIMSYAQKEGLDDFRKKWGEKQYSDKDHTIYHMVKDLVENLEK